MWQTGQHKTNKNNETKRQNAVRNKEVYKGK